MLVAAARGETKDEIDAALSFSNDTGPAFHEARNDVAQALEARNRPASGETAAQWLRVSNDFWLHPEFTPEENYLNTLSSYYGVGVFLAPFDTDPEAARVAINDKVARDTEQLIRDLLPRGSVDDAVFVLTNALYFKANWSKQFSKSATRAQPFLGTAGEESVQMMTGTILGRHFASSDYEAIALPYLGGELEFVAIMPPAGTFESFAAGLSAERVSAAVSSLVPANLALELPRLDISSNVPLRERLEALGMRRAFTPEADLSGAGPDLYLQDAFHQATLKLDEEGTEAAAATALVGTVASAPPPPIPVKLDHSFVFFIRDVPTDSLLFVGHFANP
jgi:serpin B